jgi:ligand-binding sensor protein
MDFQKDGDFEKAWQENRHIWESTKNLAKAMFYAGQAKAQAVPEGFVLVNKKDLVKVLNCVTDDWLVDTDSFEEFKKIESLVQDEVDAMLEAQEPK